MKIERHCICCEKKLEPCGGVEPDSLSNPPNEATYWQTSGNFGSRVFDSPVERLETYICDDCLKEKARFVYRFQMSTETSFCNVRTFDPSEE